MVAKNTNIKTFIVDLTVPNEWHVNELVILLSPNFIMCKTFPLRLSGTSFCVVMKDNKWKYQQQLIFLTQYIGQTM